jgi:hypothetical protein
VTHARLIAVGLLVLAASGIVSAQGSDPGQPDVSKARVRVGHLLLNPTLALTNLGVDTNVFNEPDQSSPKSDFTITVTPQTDLWLRMGRSWVIGNVKDDLVWYQTFASERSSNHSAKVGWLVPLNRFKVNVAADYVSARERPGFEIATRSERTEIGFDASAEVRASAKTSFGVHGTQRRIAFDSVATFNDTSLREALNRTVTTGSLLVRHQLTRLTRLSLEASRGQDRFEFSPLRDSQSTSIVGSVDLKPRALINGSASLGFRDFQPQSPGVPGYQGATAAVDLSYVAFRMTRLSLQAARDVQYSYDINFPYYLQTGAVVSVTQHVFGPMDIVARGGLQRLAYRDRAGAVVTVSNRIDSIHMYGGGAGYRIGRRLRLGFNVDHTDRTSAVDYLQYNGLIYGTSITYVR